MFNGDGTSPHSIMQPEEKSHGNKLRRESAFTGCFGAVIEHIVARDLTKAAVNREAEFGLSKRQRSDGITIWS